MNKLSMILLLAGALGVSACNNPDRFGAGGADGAGGAGGGIMSAALGDPNDPNSPAYFNQTIGDTVRFAVDQSVLTPESQNVLAGQAQWMNQHPQYNAVVEGHADEQGTREYNIALGARRAAAVQEFLIAQGVSPARLRTVSYGKERPLAICSDEACYAQNRRAVTVITVGGGV
ncbi:peptidoglycan-associated lipoprotein Pal [Defluviimonas sp. WL0075]|uniref:Peptidoglycan-associated lipoprotein n=1 Tax=Albidovulum sediminicola TaxID=2984331 RepID=A0ABT2Z539_9RHOB|nr:peptidoglycan-associated lipoprotein Pal [Defluviimonas sp. WL0075]MCV2866226.1 peptidoglycan-associated lipoprotein Pal [Defluviimonas sp. WL0075]